MSANGINFPEWVRPTDCECVTCPACLDRRGDFDLEAFTERLRQSNQEFIRALRERT